MNFSTSFFQKCAVALLAVLVWSGTVESAISQNLVEFSIRNRKVIGDTYFAELWAKVASSDKPWAVSGCNFVIYYNAKSLDAEWFNNLPAADVNSELIGKNNYYDITQTKAGEGKISMNIQKFMPPYSDKAGEFRVASYRWKVINSALPDELRFDTELTQVFTKTQMLDYNCGTADCYGAINPAPVLAVNEQSSEKSEEMTVQISPNPARNKIEVEINLRNVVGASIEISALDGKSMIKSEYKAATGLFNTMLEIQDLPSGAYFLRLTANGQTIVKKFVKE